jgi:molecular chaperone DnaK
VNQAVITVPANFSDAQRQATREAGLIAGLDVLRLVNEPTAAALAYGYGKRLDEIVAVFDFGGGTFDVSLLKIRAEIFEVLATDGDMFLGGDDLDRAIAEHLAAEMVRTMNIDPRAHVEAMTRLRMAAEEIKAYLSEEDEASGEIDGIVVTGHDEPLRLPFEIQRPTFESMISGYVDKTIELCRHVLTSAKIDPRSVADVILVGGSTRIPLVRRKVAALFGREPRTDINPDEVVAHGAAVQAAMLSGRLGAIPAGSSAVAIGSAGTSDGEVVVDLDLDLPSAAMQAGKPRPTAPPPRPPAAALLLDVTPAALSIATVSGFAERLLERNAPIPIERTRSFTTSRDAQTRVVIEVCRGDARRFEDNEPLGSLELDAIEPGRRGEADIEVTFRIDADGILNVRARDVRTNQEQQVRLNVIGAPEPAGPGRDLPARP